MAPPRRLLSVGHSYVVRLNRRLAGEVARASGGRWEVTVAAPQFVAGDLRPIPLEPADGESAALVGVPYRLSARPHLAFYGCRLRTLLRERWDLVHCWEEPYVVGGAQVARWAGANPVVFYSFQNLAKRYPPPFSWLERYTVGRAAGWLAAGETVRETLIHRPGYAARPYAVIWLGVDTDLFRPDAAARAAIRRRLGWAADGPPVVGYLGRFVHEKGLDLLTRALDRVAAPWRALFVGSGPHEAALRAWAGGQGDRARVVTGVKHDEAPAYLNAMDVLAAPSQTARHWREQLGRMLIEAFACGVPVVGSDSGEIPHVVGDAGVVLPEADEPAWSAALADLIASPAQRAELVRRGLARAADHFAWPVIARQHLEFFDRLTAGGHDVRD